jgi:hypothetical protein
VKSALAERETGPYWIRDTDGDWQVAYWDGDIHEWYEFGDDKSLDPEWVAEIGERVKREAHAARLVAYDLTAPTKYLRFPPILHDWEP